MKTGDNPKSIIWKLLRDSVTSATHISHRLWSVTWYYIYIMFEKSLYDLIRGLRNHKGNEREYIQDSIRECRREIKTNDMDLKATALMKLTYLEMFGHDMSWASFNVLEVMSSQKYLQKRVGYLAAVQSFRPDTEVLMLAENLLKKDLTSPLPPTIALPLVAIPHVISPSMANSLLSDMLPRLTHTHPSIRKKTIVTLYRLALVYPETLRPAWPKIKERLLDATEDSSVTAAVVNVVCELGWRRPQDFLPLAPRLFELLVEGNNNWMAIKIIKLFAVLTPLEPRLVKKLLPPLTSIIKTTPAMSLLYECINGIIQGGILETGAGTNDGDDIARLCVGKLRGMLVVEGDPNLKYVALLAFNKVVTSHPYLVALHEDVILKCIDDADITIRLRALELVAGMVNAQNLTSIVDRLLHQLQHNQSVSQADEQANSVATTLYPLPDEDDGDLEQPIRRVDKKPNQPPPLTDEYRRSVISKILHMCSRHTYANISDFDWYIDILVKLIGFVPPAMSMEMVGHSGSASRHPESDVNDLAFGIGTELRNVAVRVKSSRKEAVRAAELLVSTDSREGVLSSSGVATQMALEPVSWMVGEFPNHLASAESTMTSLLSLTNTQLASHVLATHIQAVVKVLAFLLGDDQRSWTPQRKTVTALLLARAIHSLEPLVTHPNLEVQERAVEYLELIRLANEAVAVHSVDTEDGNSAEPPLLLTQAIPALFTGIELNPVAAAAQKKVPIPDELDLDAPINENLQALLDVPDFDSATNSDDLIWQYYNKRDPPAAISQPAIARLESGNVELSYQNGDTSLLHDPQELARRKAETRERHKDDPFYIASDDGNDQVHNILRSNNGQNLDVDDIPIMELNLENTEMEMKQKVLSKAKTPKKVKTRTFVITGDETIDGGASAASTAASSVNAARSKRSLLQVDSSGLGSLSLDSSAVRATQLDVERKEAEDAEMAKAMREVERLRLEMQRAAERVQEPSVGTVVKRKKKKTVRVEGQGRGEADPLPAGDVVKKSKEKGKKKEQQVDDTTPGSLGVEPTSSPAAAKSTKKPKRRQITFDENGA